MFKYKSWRRKGQALPEVLSEYKSVGAELNVMPYCSQFIPIEVINHPELKSICFHPSLLPVHRGASAISWTLIQGDKKGWIFTVSEDSFDILNGMYCSLATIQLETLEYALVSYA